MFRRTMSIVLTLAMLLGIIVIPCNVQKTTEDTLVIEDTTSISSQMEVDGSIVKCTYDKGTSGYDLYLDEVKYDLNVDMYDGCAMVYLANSNNTDDYTEQVIGQSTIALTLSAGYWAPAIVAAAKVVIASVITATLAVATYYSAELIATTINGVKTKSITKDDLRVKTRTTTRALDLVKATRKNKGVYYYCAYLYKGMVMIGNQINFKAAVSRLKRGYDVFASNQNAALAAAKSASINGGVKFDKIHKGKKNILPHYHPYGRKWILDSRSMPHCWFPTL